MVFSMLHLLFGLLVTLALSSEAETEECNMLQVNGRDAPPAPPSSAPPSPAPPSPVPPATVKQENEDCGSADYPHAPPDGGDCALGFECNYEKSGKPGDPGKCVKQPLRQEYAECGKDQSGQAAHYAGDCAEGLACIYEVDSTYGACGKPPRQIDEKCGSAPTGDDWFGDCADGLTCHTEEPSIQSTCRLIKSLNQQCGPAADPGAPAAHCEAGLECVADSKIGHSVCVEIIRQEGESCGEHHSSTGASYKFGKCADGLQCITNWEVADSVPKCELPKPKRIEGESCGWVYSSIGGSVDNGDCAEGLVCKTDWGKADAVSKCEICTDPAGCIDDDSKDEEEEQEDDSKDEEQEQEDEEDDSKDEED